MTRVGRLLVGLLLFAVGCQQTQTPPTDPNKLPIYNVAPGGLPDATATAIATTLGIPGNPKGTDGALRFTDISYLKVPTVPATGGVADDGSATGEAIDFAALKNLKVFGDADAMGKAKAAFDAVGNSFLAGALPAVQNSSFEALDKAGASVANVKLDTRVAYDFKLEGLPLIGPGAKANVSFDAAGKATSLLFAARNLSKGPSVTLISRAEAQAQAAAAYLAGTPGLRSLKLESQGLVYYAPPLSQNVQKLFPHYVFGGTAELGGQTINLLQTLVPAISTAPKVTLSANADGASVSGKAEVSGGTAPYTFEWVSSLVDLEEQTQGKFDSSIQYRVLGREAGNQTERLTVVVTDANGLTVQASKDLLVQPVVPKGQAGLSPQVAGVRDAGIERGVSDLGAANQAGFRNRFAADGVNIRFNFSGSSAWDRDFLEPASGTDSTYIDNVDIAFYIGHGWGGGFTFENTTHNDGNVTYAENIKWGNGDLEWLALLSCQVLRDSQDGKNWAQRWGPAFDGLHLLMGFETNAYDWANFGGRFADYTLGRNFFGTTITLPVRAAWVQAAAEEQPDSVVTIVMGVYGNGGLAAWNDFYHGKGAVGPDLRGADIQGWWRLRVP